MQGAFQPAVGVPRAALRQTKSLAPVAAPRVADLVAGYGRGASPRLDATLERRSADECASSNPDPELNPDSHPDLDPDPNFYPVTVSEG